MNTARYSPGQSGTNKFPIVGEHEPSSEISNWQLEVRGLVRQPLQFSLGEFLHLPTQQETWDTICVTGWTRLDDRWRGVSLQALLHKAQPLPEARFVRFVAYSHRNHDTSLPLDYALSRVLLATEINGAALGQEHGGPVRSVCGGKYFYKSVKWLRAIELIAEDKPGYWEEFSSYHNNADPWKNERYVPQPLSMEEFRWRCEARDFSGVVAIRDEQFKQLSGLDLSGANFVGAQIKGCPLQNTALTGANCTRANFTLSNFANADLRGAVMLNCDLEGANLQNADLRGADLRGASLTATKFVRSHRPAKIEGVRFSRLSVQSEGVNLREQAFLLDPQHGALFE